MGPHFKSPRRGRERDRCSRACGLLLRASKVKPKVNEYCRYIRSYGKASPMACIPNMGARCSGKIKETCFREGPLWPNLLAGISPSLSSLPTLYTLALVKKTKCAIYSEDLSASMIIRTLGTGANAANYARFAEVKVVLDFMRELARGLPRKTSSLSGT